MLYEITWLYCGIYKKSTHTNLQKAKKEYYQTLGMSEQFPNFVSQVKCNFQNLLTH